MVRGKKNKLILALFLTIISLANAAGCWSRRELEGLAYVLMLGIDTTPEGNFKIFAQVGLPTQPSQGGEGPVIAVLTTEGRDLTEALDNLHHQSTRQPDLSHLRMVVLSEKFAREGFESALDLLRRDTRIRLNCWIAVADQDIGKMLMMEDPLKSQPASAVTRLLEINIKRSSVAQVEILDLVTMLLEPDREPYLPIIEVTEERWILGKTAVFRGDRMAAILDKDQTFGLLLWHDEVSNGVFTVPQPGEERDISYRIISSATRVSTRWNGDRLQVRARVESTLDIAEIRGQDPHNAAALANAYIIKRMKDAVDVAWEQGTDFLGLAANFRRTDPQGWSALQNKWNTVLRDAEYDVQGKVTIRGQGQTR